MKQEWHREFVMKKNAIRGNYIVLLPAAATDDITISPTVRMRQIGIRTITLALSLNVHLQFFTKAQWPDEEALTGNATVYCYCHLKNHLKGVW